MERKTNKEVMEAAQYRRSLIKTIRKRQMLFLGHVCRTKDIERLMLTGKIEGRKSRGRQRLKYMDSLRGYIAQEHTNEEILEKAGNRESWRTLVADICNRCGT